MFCEQCKPATRYRVTMGTHTLRPTLAAPRPAVLTKGLVPAAAYLGSSIAYVVILLGPGT